MRERDTSELVNIRQSPGDLKSAEAAHAHDDDLQVSGLENEASRRRFLEVMGASLALAAGAGCTRPTTEFLMPYVEPPESAIPGRPKYFATAVQVGGDAQGVIVESHLGRPTKVEGNPLHPASLGATNVQAQASVLELYDPDRSKEIMQRNVPDSWDRFAVALQQALDPVRKSNGRGFRVLTETVVSPTLGDQITRLLAQFPEARWHQWDPAGPHAARAGAMAAFGRYVHTFYRLAEAEVILSLGSDFLADGPGSTRYAHDFAFARRVRGARTEMNRLYVAETSMTSTGGKADHRVPLKYSEMDAFAAELASALGVPGVPAAATGRYARWTGPVSRDLLAHRGRSAVLVGENMPPAVHAIAHAINHSLGNNGTTVIYTEPAEVRPENQLASLRLLVDDMWAGNVQLLIILAGNPVYNSPIDLQFGKALDRVPMSVHLALYPDETSRVTTWHLPESHSLEAWGDTRAFDGTITIQQPLILPLYHSHTQAEILDIFLEVPNRDSERIVRSYWQTNSGAADFDAWWRRSVGQGLVPDSASPEITPPLQAIDTAALNHPPPRGKLDLVFRTDPFIYDGRFANNAWLQELPRHMTKLTWDNAVHVSPRTAKRLNLVNQEYVELKFRGYSVKGAVWITPGDAEDTVTVHLGYGRSHAGKVAAGAGFNAYLIRPADALWFGTGVEVHPTGTTYPLATAQMHKSMEGRDLIVSKPVDFYRSNPSFVQEIHPGPKPEETLYPEWKFTGYNWGMSIDLTACVNCSACVIACQAENNIPVVGKSQQLFNREMHWLRVDTYYSGDLDHPSALYQPVPCMHCENAPCEVVCPVQATLHSADGVNDMIYNRCIGTRFCSNNCPYKVRRFNFMLYADWYTEPLKMVHNPDVTIRSRGVIEKCTYCVQRIREAEIRSQNEHRYIRDGEIQTACQQVCPTRAIAFGDMNNPTSRVSQLKGEKLNYALLADLNTRPHTTYLAELRNPNPEMPGTP
jgi:Fe-S-cluster-containing dehydrogenase component/anaerobic selenocysteine-containing dehydrogenase